MNNWILLLSAVLLVGASVAQPEGVTFEVVLTLEGIANVDGGVDEDETLLGNLDLTMSLDTAEAGWWDNGTVFAYVLGNFDTGRLPTEFVGDLQATSNFEATETIKLYELWYEHQFGNAWAILAGLHDYNGEFDVLEYAGLFAHSSAGISPDISQAGPSIFPTTALALRGRWQAANGTYLLGAAYDGVPGDPGDDRGTQVILDSDDGVFWAAELGRTVDTDDRYWKVAVGGWYLTEATATDGSGIDNYGLYAIAESAISDAGLNGPGVFLQLGSARPGDNVVDWYVGGGVTWPGIVPNRPDDLAGLGIFHAHLDDAFRGLPGNGGFASAETAVELTYRAVINERVAIQPGLQFVDNPAGDASADDAVIGFLRVELTLW